MHLRLIILPREVFIMYDVDFILEKRSLLHFLFLVLMAHGK